MWQLENRTTCAVEAINGVIGRGIPTNSNFFNFVHFLQRFELARSIKFRNLYARCLIKKKRARSQESSTIIRNATELLDSEKISVSEFLDCIANMKIKQYSKITTITNKHAISSDDESDDDHEETTPAHTHTSQRHTTHTSKRKRARTDSMNLCRMCDLHESNIILLPCAHAVICSECWSKKALQNDKFCVQCFEAVNIATQF